MKKYLREIETSGIIMLFLGFILGHLISMDTGAIMAAIGLLLWASVVVYKALHWNVYRRDNILNIIIMMGAVIAIFITFRRLSS